MTGGVEQGMVSTGKRFGSHKATTFAQLENGCGFNLFSFGTEKLNHDFFALLHC
jgi:hypothetical protein